MSKLSKELFTGLKAIEQSLSTVRVNTPQLKLPEGLEESLSARHEREERVAEATAKIAEAQPVIADALTELLEETRETSKYQRRVNKALLLFAFITLVVSIIGLITSMNK